MSLTVGFCLHFTDRSSETRVWEILPGAKEIRSASIPLDRDSDQELEERPLC